jgi:hypothetical protein
MIEHYMILLLIIKARNNVNLQDQLLNLVRDHLDKEKRLIETARLNDCVSNDLANTIGEFISNINNGLLMVSDPEFVSSYISNFTDALRIIAKYMVNHEELASKVMTELQRVVRDCMKILM